MPAVTVPTIMPKVPRMTRSAAAPATSLTRPSGKFGVRGRPCLEAVGKEPTLSITRLTRGRRFCPKIDFQPARLSIEFCQFGRVVLALSCATAECGVDRALSGVRLGADPLEILHMLNHRQHAALGLHVAKQKCELR